MKIRVMLFGGLAECTFDILGAFVWPSPEQIVKSLRGVLSSGHRERDPRRAIRRGRATPVSPGRAGWSGIYAVSCCARVHTPRRDSVLKDAALVALGT